MKRLLPIFVALMILLAACSKSSSTSNNAGTIHNSVLGIDITLGMDKTKIDELLGDPIESTSIYTYSDSGFAAMYNEGEAVMLFVTDNQWVCTGNVKVSDTASTLTEQFGESNTSEGITYLFDKRSKITSDKKNATVIAMFNVADTSIDSYTLVDYTIIK